MGGGTLDGVVWEVLVDQGLQGSPNRGGGGPIRKFKIAFRVRVDLVLHNLRE